MIQRKQTIYFLLALLAIIGFLLTPLAFFDDDMTVTAFTLYTGVEKVKTSHLPIWLYGILSSVCIVFIVLTIGSFKNRPLQMKLAGASLLLSTVLAVLNFIQLDKLRFHEMPDANISYGMGSFGPVVAIAFMILGYRGVKKDEDLIKSIDRLR